MFNDPFMIAFLVMLFFRILYTFDEIRFENYTRSRNPEPVPPGRFFPDLLLFSSPDIDPAGFALGLLCGILAADHGHREWHRPHFWRDQK